MELNTLIMNIKEQFSRIYSADVKVGEHLSKKPKSDYYGGIKIWGQTLKGGERD